jgi:protease-4
MEEASHKPEKKVGCILLVIGLVAFIAACVLTIITVSVIGISQLVSDDEPSDFPGDYNRQLVSGDKSSDNTILVIPVNGIIHSGREDSPFGAEGAGANKICRQLNVAANDKTVKAVILRIDSPGGEVVASDRIYNAIKQVRKQGKPVVALMESVAASGGYYISAGCNKIVAHPLTTTGSIGVIIQTFKYYDLFKKIGLQSESFTSGPLKDILSGTRPTTIIEKKIIQQNIDAVYNRFVEVCAEGRPGLTAKKIKNSIIGDGRIFLGTEAKKLGLVDKLGYFKDAEELTAKLAGLGTDYSVVTYRRRFSLSKIFTSEMEGNTNRKELKLELPGAAQGYNLQSGKFYYLPAWN